MPNIEFYFPSTGLSALLELLTAEWGGTTQLSLAGPDKLVSPSTLTLRAPLLTFGMDALPVLGF